MATRSEQLADAMLAIAKTNHYMVGLVERFTVEEISEAMDMLITQQNNLEDVNPFHAQYNLALDLIEVEYKRILQGVCGCRQSLAAQCANPTGY